MKEERTKEESNNKETKEKSLSGLEFAPETSERRLASLYIDWDAFIAFFNDTLRRFGSNIPRLEFVSKGKKTQVQSLVNEYNTKQALMIAVEKMARSDFLNGRRKGRPFVASFAWLFEKEANFEKVLNGYYDNPPEVDPTEEEKRKQAEEQRQREAEERKRKNNEIDQQIKAEQRRAREEAHAHRATPEQLEEIFKNFKLPPLKAEPK